MDAKGLQHNLQCGEAALKAQAEEIPLLLDAPINGFFAQLNLSFCGVGDAANHVNQTANCGAKRSRRDDNDCSALTKQLECIPILAVFAFATLVKNGLIVRTSDTSFSVALNSKTNIRFM